MINPMPSSLDLDRIKAAIGKCCFVQMFSGQPEPWTESELLDLVKYPSETIEAVIEVLNAAPALVAEVERLRARVDELEDENESLKEDSEEFGGDCWKALKSLLDECNWNWADDPELTADDAREHICTTISELEDDASRLRAEVASAKAEGAAEWHEAEAKELYEHEEQMMRDGEEPYERRKVRDKAIEHAGIAAELRKEIK